MTERTMMNSYITQSNTEKLCIFLTGGAYAPYTTCMATSRVVANHMSMDSVHAAADREATAVEVMDHACVMYDDTLSLA